MTPHAIRGYLALLLLALAGGPVSTAYAVQVPSERADSVKTREVRIIHAGTLTGSVVDGERIEQLAGDVRLRHEETELRADRAISYQQREQILFLGNVRIVNEGDSLAADTVLYDQRGKTGRARGSVRLSDGEVEVFAPSGLYYSREKRAVFEEGVELVDSTGALRSRGGAYWTDEKRAEFYGDVVLEQSETNLTADSVTYHRETEVAVARGAVLIERLGEPEADSAATDTTVRTLLFGDYAYNDERGGYSRIEGSPLLVQLRQDSVDARVDTLLIRAVTLEAFRRDSLQRLIAVDSVRIWQRDLAAVADSVVHDRVTGAGREAVETAQLFGGPVAWFERSQVTGDTVRVHARAGSVDTLVVRGGAFVATQDTALARVNQLRGRDLQAVFRDDSLRTLRIGPNAEVIHFRTDGEGAPAGALQTSADRIVFHFEGEDVRKIVAVRGNEGTYYPEALLPEPFELDGFRWIPEQRPGRERMLDGLEVPERPFHVPALAATRPGLSDGELPHPDGLHEE